MFREIGFTTSTNRVFKGPAASAVIPVGKPKKQSGRFRLAANAKRTRSPTGAAGEGDIAHADDTARTQEEGTVGDISLLSAGPCHHEMIVLGLNEAVRPTIFVSDTSSDAPASSMMPLSAYSKRLVEKHSGVACPPPLPLSSSSSSSSAALLLEGYISAQLLHSRWCADEELERSLVLQRLREAMEMTVGASLLGVEAAKTSATYLTSQLADRAEVQGILPALIFESLSLASEVEGGDADKLLPHVASEAYPKLSLSREALDKLFRGGVPLTFMHATASAAMASEQGGATAVDAYVATALASSSASTVDLPYSASVQQRLYKSAHDVFKGLAVAEASNARVRASQQQQQVSTSVTTAAGPSSVAGSSGGGNNRHQPKPTYVNPFVRSYYDACKSIITPRDVPSSMAEAEEVAAANSAEPTTVGDDDITAIATVASTLLSAQLLMLASIYRRNLRGQGTASIVPAAAANGGTTASASTAADVSADVEVVVDAHNKEVTFDYGRRRHRITLSHYKRLRVLYGNCLRNCCGEGDATAAADAEDAFSSASLVSSPLLEKCLNFRLFTMLERYFALSGCQPQLSNEGGWHAAVPSDVMRAFAQHQSVACEAFASPLNTASYYFGSAFVDTDCHFGSIGSFFTVPFVKGAVEVNPPFDPTVAVQTIAHIKSCLGRAAALGGDADGASSLVFSVTIPTTDSTKPATASAASSEAPKQLQSAAAFVNAVETCGYLLAQKHLAGADAPYRDGNEFVSEGTHFLTRMGTLVATMGTPMTAEHQSKQAAALEAIATKWKSLCDE